MDYGRCGTIPSDWPFRCKIYHEQPAARANFCSLILWKDTKPATKWWFDLMAPQSSTLCQIFPCLVSISTGYSRLLFHHAESGLIKKLPYFCPCRMYALRMSPNFGRSGFQPLEGRICEAGHGQEILLVGSMWTRSWVLTLTPFMHMFTVPVVGVD